MRSIERTGLAVRLLDQTKLPMNIVFVTCSTVEQMCTAICSMQIRGAPALGVAAAYGMALGATNAPDETQAFAMRMTEVASAICATRPTAVNLSWGVKQAQVAAECALPLGVAAARSALWDVADELAAADMAVNVRLGEHGAALLPDRARVLTHCNAGALATVGWGTALGVLRSAVAEGKDIHVFVDETRPFLQGSRLTAWELSQESIPYTVITDSMAAHFMARGEIDLCIVGADRIAANGDVANKIGTYGVAILARAHNLPFYVAAPLSTIDLSIETGAEIPIEERDPAEVLSFAGISIAPEGAAARHPAFDVTPARYVTAIVTEAGVLVPPFDQALTAAVESSAVR